MTVPAVATTEVRYIEDGETLSFPYPYRFLNSGDLDVGRSVAGGAFLPVGGWSAAGAGDDAGGIVTLTASVAGATLRIRRATTIEQPTHYVPLADFPAESHELALDRATMALQDAVLRLAELGQRAVVAQDGEAGFVLPPLAQRTGLVGWGPEGSLVAATLPAVLTAQATISVWSKAIMAALALPIAGTVVFLSSNTDPSHWVVRAGAAPDADPLQGLYVSSAVPGYFYARVCDGVHGRPEWFGAIVGDKASAAANLAAFNECHRLCQTVLLSAGIYWLSDTFAMTRSATALRGCGVSADGQAGSTLGLTGAEAITHTQFQLGTGDATAPARWQVVDGVTFLRDTSGGVRPSTDANPINSVTGILFSGSTNSIIRNCRVLDSPLGVLITGTAACGLFDNNVDRATPATTAANDFYTAYAAGGYATNYGFVGSNGSLRLERNTAFGSNAGFVKATHTLIFGYGADTFVSDIEGSLMEYGVVVDGRDAAGTVIAASGAMQDIELWRVKMDGFAIAGILGQHCGRTADIEIWGPYGASSGAGIVGQDIGGRFTLRGGKMYGAQGQTGISFDTVGDACVDGTFVRDFGTPCTVTNCVAPVIKPEVDNVATNANAAVALYNCQRGVVAPQVKGSAHTMSFGITMDAACGQMEVDGSAIDPGCFINVDAQYKVRFNGADARVGFGSNVLVGVTA